MLWPYTGAIGVISIAPLTFGRAATIIHSIKPPKKKHLYRSFAASLAPEFNVTAELLTCMNNCEGRKCSQTDSTHPFGQVVRKLNIT